MPRFTLTTRTSAPVEEVWKLLFDPTRFPEWWAGVETVRVGGTGSYTMWPDGYPDFPMPQLLRTDRAAGKVTISCQVSDIEVVWQIGEQPDGSTVTVCVELPESEAHRLAGQREVIGASLRTLATLAEAAADPAPPAVP
jgi:uncharacterized protein YndB with AHSA1/START domain